MPSRIEVFRTREAASYAASLFFKRFRQPFPVPRENCGLSIPTPPENWRQYVAVYRAPGAEEETIGFCNWIRYGDAYLAGGLCVDEMAYRRMDPEDFRYCRGRGGIAQMLLDQAAVELNDCGALFGYVGDRKSMAVSLRSGYERTDHPYIIAKWLRPLTPGEKRSMVERIAAIGAF